MVKDRHEVSRDILRTSIENFGPISKGEIRLKPLTILMGPNNSGKSYAATLIYSLLSAHAAARYGFLRPILFQNPPTKLDYSSVITSTVKKLIQTKDCFTIPTTRASRRRLVNDVFAPILKATIEGSFGSPISELIKSGQRSSNITITGSDIYKIQLTDKMRILPQFDNTVHKVKIVRGESAVQEEYEGDARTLCVDERFKTSRGDFLYSIIGGFLIGSLKPQMNLLYYLPAARSGILQGHRALAASFMQHAPYAGIDSFEIPRLTQVVSNFISELIDLPRRSGSFTPLSNDLERELIGGSIGLTQHGRHSTPDIVYQLPNGNVPLHRSSSTVSEMAPLSLYLKHVIRKNDLLIIEEPEAHLHASKQIVFAKYIAKMIRQGLNLLITTHSYVLMEALNSHLVASDMDPKSRVKVGIDKNDYLTPNEVAPYLFREDGKGGYVITPVEMDAHGVALKEFIDVIGPLYERGIRQDRWIEQHGS